MYKEIAPFGLVGRTSILSKRAVFLRYYEKKKD
jgi:hypothetical protein